MAGNAVIGSLRVALGLDTAEFETGLKQVQSQLGGIGKAFAVLGGTAVFAGFVSGIGAAVGRIEEMRKLSAQLDKALENTGNTARTSAREVEEFGDRLEKSTGRAAEEIMAVSTNLATFGFGRDTFFRAIELANDMAAAWGGDLKQNIEGVGRALAEPEKGLAMLTKRGITFDEQQKAQIAQFMKVNDLAGAQGVIFEALEGQVKGVAQAGFGGLTKATANAWKAVEDFFEAIASATQVNVGLEMSLVAATAAIDFLTANLGTLGKVAGVVGTAVAVAMGPAVWAAMTTAATMFGAAAVGAIRAIGAAIIANPIGFIVTGLAAAVSAAFLFRDEMKTLFGVDFAGIIIDTVNGMVGAFVGAYNAVRQAWSNLPTFFSAIGKQSYNEFISEFEKPLLTFGDQVIIPGMDMSGLKAELTELEQAALGTAKVVFDAAQVDYVGGWWTRVFGEGGAAAVVKGFDDIAAAATNAGGVIGSEMQKALDALRMALMTEEEAELASYQKRLAQIAEFYAAGAIMKDEHDAMIERANEQHTERMLQIERKRAAEEARIRDMAVGGFARVLGSISSLIEKSGDKNLGAAKAFAVGEAVVNTALGITKALTLPPPASWAQAAAVAASGAAQIATIMSASKGTSSRPAVKGSPASSAATAAAAPEATAVYVTLKGGGLYSRDNIEELFTAINGALGDGFKLNLQEQ